MQKFQLNVKQSIRFSGDNRKRIMALKAHKKAAQEHQVRMERNQYLHPREKGREGERLTAVSQGVCVCESVYDCVCVASAVNAVGHKCALN